MNLMSRLTRFDSEMHEDEDDLEEVAAPIGDQQVSNIRFVSKPFFCKILKTNYSSFCFFYRARSR